MEASHTGGGICVQGGGGGGGGADPAELATLRDANEQLISRTVDTELEVHCVCGDTVLSLLFCSCYGVMHICVCVCVYCVCV